MTESQNLEFSIKVKSPQAENPDAETRGYVAVAVSYTHLRAHETV